MECSPVSASIRGWGIARGFVFPNEIYKESIANEVWVSVHPPLLRSVRKGKEVIAMIFKNLPLGEADIYMTPK